MNQKNDTRAHPKGGVNFNYAEVAPHSPDWPFAIMSLLLLNGELYITAVFVRRISMTD